MRRVLVVDDQAILRESVEAILRAEGFEVFTASNGIEALTAIANDRPDLVLLDLNMPALDGLSVLRRVREQEPPKPVAVVVMSAEADRGRIIEAAKLGISGYLLKSEFSVRLLLEKVRAAVAGPDPAAVPIPASSPARAATRPTAPAPTPARMEGDLSPIAPTAPQPGRAAAPGPSLKIAGSTLPTGAGQVTTGDLKSLRPLLTRAQLLESIKMEGELTGFSPTVSQVLKITASPSCSMEQVAKAVACDHAVALKILRLANSSVYPRGERVDTVHKAVLRIGMQSIRQAVMNIGVVERFGSLSFKEHLSTPMFWEHSIACGLIAAELAHALGHKEPDIAFTAGLLHDLGRVICADRLGELYIRVLETARSLQLPLEEVESRLLLMNHAQIMDKALLAWRFPKDLVDPILHHHAEAADIKALAAKQSIEVLRLGLANRLAHALVLGSSGNDTIYATEEHCRLLGVDGAMIRRIEETARQQTDDTKIALLANSGGGIWPRRIEHYRAMLGDVPGVLYVSAAPELDAFRLFFDEFCGPPDQAEPALAVVHVAAARELPLLSQRLAASERSGPAAPLPLLVLSPGGTLALDATIIGPRPTIQLATPTPIERLVKAVQSLCGRGEFKQAA